MNELNLKIIAGFVFLLSACNSDTDPKAPPSAAAANEEFISCAANEAVDPTNSKYNWEQVGDSIYGTPPPVGHDLYDQLVGLDVGISSDGAQVVSTIGKHIRSYSLDERGLVTSDADIPNDDPYVPQINLSGDGSTLLLRDPEPDGDYSSYSAKILTRSSTNGWTVVENYREPEMSLGSIATNASGNLIAMSYFDNYSDSIIRTYRLLDDGSWLQLDPIIGAPGESLGGNLKLSNDGLTMIAEKTYEVINVYRLIDDKWVHQAINTSEYVFSEYIPNPDTSTIPDNWKGHVRNVALSGNGKVIAVGYVSTTFRTTKDFTVRLYRFEDGSIHQIGQTLEAAYRHDSFGDALELNCDGSIVTIGADTKWTLGNQPGYVRSFANVNDVWHQIGGDILSNYDGLGGLDISSDGRIIVVGQVNDYSGDVQKHNFYGELKVFELVQRDLEK